MIILLPGTARAAIQCSMACEQPTVTKTSSHDRGGRLGQECAAAIAVLQATEPEEAVYPWLPLKNARMTAATASSGGLRCPYAVGSPCAREISSFFGFSLPTRLSTMYLMGFFVSFNSGFTVISIPSSMIDIFVKFCS